MLVINKMFCFDLLRYLLSYCIIIESVFVMAQCANLSFYYILGF